MNDKITTILRIGKLQLNLTAEEKVLLKRKELLGVVRDNINKDSSSVLEIEFLDGIISKNLNYYGYDVTAVD